MGWIIMSIAVLVFHLYLHMKEVLINTEHGICNGLSYPIHTLSIGTVPYLCFVIFAYLATVINSIIYVEMFRKMNAIKKASKRVKFRHQEKIFFTYSSSILILRQLFVVILIPVTFKEHSWIKYYAAFDILLSLNSSISTFSIILKLSLSRLI